MFDAKIARLSAYRNNIHRYRRVLRTKLTELERGFILRRLEQEEALQTLTESDSRTMGVVPIEQPHGAEAGHV